MIFKRLIQDSAIYGGADFFSKLLAFFTFPLIATALSPKAFGALELITTIVGLLGLLINCGLNNAVQRFYWDKDTLDIERPSVISSGLAAQVIFGLFLFIVGCFSLPLIMPIVENSTLPLTWVAIVAALFLMMFSQWQQYLLDVTRLHFSPWKFLVISLLSRTLGLILGVITVVYLGWGVDGLLSIQALVLFLVLPIAILAVKKDITFAINFTWAKKLIGYGHPFIFAGMAYWLFGAIDRWMLAAMSSVEEVGIYSVAFRFASIVLFVSMAFGQAWSPVAIKVMTDHPNFYRAIYAKVLLVLLFIMLIVGGAVALFSGEIVGGLMSTEYVESALPLAVLCIGVIFQSTQQITAIGISLEKKTFLFARITWLTVLINVILNWFLIPKYGAVGAAWATTISYLILTVSYMFYTQRLHPLPIEWHKLIFLLFLGTVVMLMALFLNQATLSPAILIEKSVVAIGCLIAGWLILPKRSI